MKCTRERFILRYKANCHSKNISKFQGFSRPQRNFDGPSSSSNSRTSQVRVHPGYGDLGFMGCSTGNL